MSRSHKTTIVLLALLGAWFAFGCGGVRQAAQKQKEANDLKQLGILYHNYYDINQKPPSKLEDMQQFAAEAPEVIAALQAGKYVLVYGIDIRKTPAGAANTVMGYESTAPTSGGQVLMADASVRTMTATEFQAASTATPSAERKGD